MVHLNGTVRSLQAGDKTIGSMEASHDQKKVHGGLGYIDKHQHPGMPLKRLVPLQVPLRPDKAQRKCAMAEHDGRARQCPYASQRCQVEGRRWT